MARRVESLVDRGCLRFRTVFEAALVGLDVEFLLWLSVDPAHIDEVGERLVKQAVDSLRGSRDRPVTT